MATVIGDLLPLAVVVAISPIPVAATILMLLAPRASAASGGFLLGWVAGIVVGTVAFTVIASTAGLSESGGRSTTGSWIRIVLGAGLLLLARRQWRGRPHGDEPAQLPKWMGAIDKVTFGKAIGLGFVLSANPKNLLMYVAAGTSIGGGDLGTGQAIVAVAVFTVIAASSVAVPVVGYAFARDRMQGPLGSLKTWLESNNATVMTVLLGIIGVVLIGKGIGGL